MFTKPKKSGALIIHLIQTGIIPMCQVLEITELTILFLLTKDFVAYV